MVGVLFSCLIDVHAESRIYRKPTPKLYQYRFSSQQNNWVMLLTPISAVCGCGASSTRTHNIGIYWILSENIQLLQYLQLKLSSSTWKAIMRSSEANFLRYVNRCYKTKKLKFQSAESFWSWFLYCIVLYITTCTCIMANHGSLRSLW